MKFTQLPLIAPIQQALSATNYITATPIQEKTIPLILAKHDVLGIAQTGTGKTAAFCLPIIQRLFEKPFKPKPGTPRALILSPTRELTLQIFENLQTYSKFSKLTSAVVYGGVSQNPQVAALKAGVDILVATTGRLLDLMTQGHVDLTKIEIFVLDEADRMLDMGFFPDITRILGKVPREKQSLFFSATMPKQVQLLADKILHQPKRVEVSPPTKTADRVEQFVCYVDKEKKLDLLLSLLDDSNLYKVIVFVEMKHLANRIAEKLEKSDFTASAIHSDKSQGARQRALDEFKTDKVRVLVATEIAARGIDVDGITHVINYDLPILPENYVHRIGRTARAGAKGVSISFSSDEEKSFLFAIEKEIGQKIPVMNTQYHSDKAQNAPVMSAGEARAQQDAKRLANKSKFKPNNRFERSPAKKKTDALADENSRYQPKNKGKPAGKRFGKAFGSGKSKGGSGSGGGAGSSGGKKSGGFSKRRG